MIVSLKNKSGMSLFEIMVVVAILGFVGVGSATMMKNMMSQQVRSNVKADLHRLRDRMVKMLENTNAWRNTIDAAANDAKLGCLRPTTAACNPATVNGTAAINTNIAIADISGPGNIFYQGNVATAGFGPNGEPCNTYSPAGNDLCPFRYEISWRVACPSNYATCDENASVTISGRLFYFPTDRSRLSGRLEVNGAGVVDGYDFSVVQEFPFVYEPLEVVHQSAAAPGNCAAGAWRNAPVNTELFDTVSTEADGTENIDGNVLIQGNFFRLDQGNYECTVMAKAANQSNGFSVRLLNVENNVVLGLVGTSSGDEDAQVTGTVGFTITQAAGARVAVQYFCRGGATAYASDMGRQIAGEQNIYRRVRCVRRK